jgi:catechol 2,3-dioxygenase-like lactoylglutathione lyase family enzyme
MNPIEIRTIDHVVLRVKDLEMALAFYRDTLGLPIERKLDIGLVQLRAGRSLIDLVPVSSQLGRLGGPAPNADGHNMDHFALEL